MVTIDLLTLMLLLASAGAVCDSSSCRLPHCLCAASTPPGGLDPSETPQLVLLTFDDHVDEAKFKLYRQIFEQRYNPNGCPIGLTFYVSHHHEGQATNYELVNQLYRLGHEIACHSVTHRNDLSYWSQGTGDRWTSEINDAVDIISRLANIPRSAIRGFRAPYLQTAGDTTFQVIQSLGFEYDSSLPTFNDTDRPLWPYTLDHGSRLQDCPREPCPRGKFPRLWTFPLNAFIRPTDADNPCPLADYCVDGAYHPATELEAFQYLRSNFERHLATKTPFGVYAHSYWFQEGNHVFRGYLRFVDFVLTKPDVYVVPVVRGLEWMRHPIRLKDLTAGGVFGCKERPVAACRPRDCFYDKSPAGGSSWLRSCTRCPHLYPWLGNPSGRTHDADEL